MDVLDAVIISKLRCVKCGRVLLSDIEEEYDGELICDRCNTYYNLHIDRVDMKIEFDDSKYIERHY